MLRLALIGCTAAARYVPLARRLRRARFAAVVPEAVCRTAENADEDARVAREIAQSLGADFQAPSFDSLLAEHRDDFDALIVHLPDRSRVPLFERAASAGKHILVDWPLALAPSRADEVIAACEQAGVCLMVGQESRFLPSVQAVKASLDSGKLGEPGLLRLHRWEAPPPGKAPARPLTREIDLACWFFGDGPSTIFATSRPSTGTEWPDYVHLHLGFPNGGMALIDHAQMLPAGGGYFSLSLIGSAGAAYADDHHNRQLLFKGGHPSAVLTEEGAGLLAMLQEFIDAVQENRPPLVTWADYLRASGVGGAADFSLGNGQPVASQSTGYVLVG
jgi:myo-inositol 2-dehydrogenase/D-chiro-inositol 1-dehydrogenase